MNSRTHFSSQGVRQEIAYRMEQRRSGNSFTEHPSYQHTCDEIAAVVSSGHAWPWTLIGQRRSDSLMLWDKQCQEYSAGAFCP
jgi:hypothetical protein